MSLFTANNYMWAMSGLWNHYRPQIQSLSAHFDPLAVMRTTKRGWIQTGQRVRNY